MYIHLFSFSITCISFLGSGTCVKESEIISNLGTFKTISECEDVRDYLINSFEYRTPTKRATLLCKDIRINKS